MQMVSPSLSGGFLHQVIELKSTHKHTGRKGTQQRNSQKHQTLKN